ncbi:hypothetical protein EV421DRAFT_1740801 [Armillaria borealis]|uniref:Uncharacterized protein n=1 Tax=Armillaria borealis TaxID=47425 RepID=A0AA39J343_9AGAR|nr:hypothetical protein EV421DRAFT_1740801 [Armillaria borealis]
MSAIRLFAVSSSSYIVLSISRPPRIVYAFAHLGGLNPTSSREANISQVHKRGSSTGSDDETTNLKPLIDARTVQAISLVGCSLEALPRSHTNHRSFRVQRKDKEQELDICVAKVAVKVWAKDESLVPDANVKT